MINQKKTELMAKTAVYEQGEGYDALRFRSHCENRKIRSALSLIALGAIIYLLILFVIYIAAGEGVIDFAGAPGRSIACVVAAVVVGVVFILIYTRIMSRLIRLKYRDLRSSMVRYDLQKSKLTQTMQEGNAETVSD